MPEGGKAKVIGGQRPKVRIETQTEVETGPRFGQIGRQSIPNLQSRRIGRQGRQLERGQGRLAGKGCELQGERFWGECSSRRGKRGRRGGSGFFRRRAG